MSPVITLAEIWPVALCALAGAIAGRFLNLVADRLPAGQPVLGGTPSCPRCGRTLGLAETVPILGYLLRHGRCPGCGATTSLRTLLVEIGAAGVAAGAWLAYGSSPATLLVGGYLLLFLLLTVIDIEHRIIPNRLVLPALALTLIITPFRTDLGMAQSALGALVAGLFLAVPIFLRPGSIGMGDLKFIVLIGLATGVPAVGVALFASAMSAGITAACLLAAGRVSRQDAIPFGPFLALGGAIGVVGGQSLWYSYIAGA